MRRIPFFRIWLCAAAFLLVIVGCGGGGKKPAKAKPGAAKPVVSQAEEAPEAVTPTVVEETRYRFRPEGKRDPFVPFISPSDEIQPGKTPLERFDLYQLKLTGIIAGKEAMALAPDGVVYYIKVGTPIGRHGGKVVRIKRDEVVVKEKFRDYRGDVQSKEVSLRFSD